MKRISLLLVLTFGLFCNSFAQVRLSLISAPGSPDTTLMFQQVTYLVVTKNTGNVTHFGSYQINIGVWDSVNQLPVIVHTQNQQPSSGSLAPNGNDTMLVVHTIDSAAYRAGGNTIVIWPTPPTGTTVDTLYKQTYVIVFNDLSELSSDAILIYPNPSSEQLYIQAHSVVEQVSIFDLNGRLIQTNSHNSVIAIQHLHNGTYLLQIELTNGEQRFSKIVIQH
ncbi:MAG: T9SS type A sorting domain-containing protein [Flavobacteriales bacterium]